MSTVHSINTKALVSQLDLLNIKQDCCDDRSEEIARVELIQSEILRLKQQGHYRKAMILEIDRLQAVCALVGQEDDKVLSCLESIGPLLIRLAPQMRRAELLTINSQPGDGLSSANPSLVSQLAEQCLRVFVEVIDPSDPGDVAVLAALFQRTGGLQTAAHLWEAAAELQQRKTGQDDMDAARYYIKLADVYSLQHRWAAAQPSLEFGLNVMRRMKGDSHAETIRVAEKLMHIYLYLQRWEEATTIQQWVISWEIKSHGGGKFKAVEPLLLSSFTHLGSKKWREAVEKGDQALSMMKELLPPNDAILDRWTSTLEVLKGQVPSLSQHSPDDAHKIYSPLDQSSRQIRLVLVKKTTKTGNLEAILVSSSLENAPPYEALSYVWGDLQDCHELKVNGNSLNITHNLWTALQHLSLNGQERVLWIDAICINQMNFAERGAQVGLMRDIYATASRTIVWLGPAGHESDIAMKILRDMEVHPSPSNILLGLLSTRDSGTLNAIHHLLVQREYWSRLWVIQEIICAKAVTVQCGESQVGFSILRDFSTLLKDVALQHKDFATLQMYSPIIRAFISSGPVGIARGGAKDTKPPLLELLNQHRTSRCTDPRDRVYGVLGISNMSNSSHPGLRIDYSAPVGKVYLGATRAIIDETSRLDVICMAAEPYASSEIPYRVRQPFLPSWAPDWNTGTLTVPLTSAAAEVNACPSMKANASFSENGTVLVAEGVTLGSIKQLAPSLGRNMRDVSGKDGREHIRTLLSWRLIAQLALGASPFGPSGILLPQFYSLLTYGDRHFAELNNSAAVWWADWQRDLMTARSAEGIKVSPAQHNYLEFVLNCCKGRRMFLLGSSSGSGDQGPPFKLGLASDAAEEGDVLCVLLGCRFPVVLRRKDDHCVFIGEAYLPDYARGEAIQDLVRGKTRSQQFHIH